MAITDQELALLLSIATRESERGGVSMQRDLVSALGELADRRFEQRRNQDAATPASERKPMRVTSLSVGVTRADGNFGNTRMDVTVELGEGDDPAEVYRRARNWVEANLDQVARRRRAETELRQCDVEIPFPQDEIAF